jgi:hypothetical protein
MAPAAGMMRIHTRAGFASALRDIEHDFRGLASGKSLVEASNVLAATATINALPEHGV